MNNKSTNSEDQSNSTKHFQPDNGVWVYDPDKCNVWPTSISRDTNGLYIRTSGTSSSNPHKSSSSSTEQRNEIHLSSWGHRNHSGWVDISLIYPFRHRSEQEVAMLEMAKRHLDGVLPSNYQRNWFVSFLPSTHISMIFF